MKLKLIAVFVIGLTSCTAAHGQGTLWPSNSGAETRLYTQDGPLAGQNILGQFFLGPTEVTLEPFLDPQPHLNGRWVNQLASVPGIPGRQTVFVQLVVWDSSLWGNSYENVPPDQFGKTDVTTHELGDPGFDPYFPTYFSQPAIVPIPEPSTWVLGLVGFGLFLITQRRRIWKC